MIRVQFVTECESLYNVLLKHLIVLNCILLLFIILLSISALFIIIIPAFSIILLLFVIISILFALHHIFILFTLMQSFLPFGCPLVGGIHEFGEGLPGFGQLSIVHVRA